jgi:hypothetical protein
VNPDKFWRIIDESRLLGSVEQPGRLAAALKALRPSEIVGFQQRFMCFVAAAHSGDVYAAGSLINGAPRSDDTFLYFRNWLVAQGRAVYESALRDPDTLSALPMIAMLGACDEEVVYVAVEVYEETTGKDYYDQPPKFECDSEETDFDWEHFSAPATLKERFPKLWKLYGNRYEA